MPSKERKPAVSWPPVLPFTRRSLIWFAVGLVVLVIGYLLLAVGPWDNPISRTIAPMVLLAAYAVIFPIAILLKGWKTEK